jgi:hypothetical protein
VASADLKLLEMPHVGLSAFWEVLRKQANLGEVNPQRLAISVNGMGNVGRAVALAFARRGFHVRAYAPAYDPSPGQLAPLRSNITPIADGAEFLRGADVLLSGTGTAPSKLADYRLLPDHAKIFNVASSNVELALGPLARAAQRDRARPYLADIGQEESDDPKWLPDWVTFLRVPA